MAVMVRFDDTVCRNFLALLYLDTLIGTLKTDAATKQVRYRLFSVPTPSHYTFNPRFHPQSAQFSQMLRACIARYGYY